MWGKQQMIRWGQVLRTASLVGVLGLITAADPTFAGGAASEAAASNAAKPVSTKPVSTMLRAAPPSSPFTAVVDFPTFMEHVLSPAANKIWMASGWIIDATGEHDLTPQTQEQWEEVVTGAATLAEATNALMIPQRQLDPAWNGLAQKLRAAAEQAYQAAERHDAKAIADIGERLDDICSACHKHYGYE